MQTAIVIMYPGEIPSSSTVGQLIHLLTNELGSDIEDRSKIHVEVMDTHGIANACVNKLANITNPTCSEKKEIPGNHAIAIIGTLFESEIKNFKKAGSLPFTTAIVRKYGNAYGGSKEDAAFLEALSILSDPNVQYDQQVARKWGFTKAIHEKLIDVYSILNR